MVQLKERVQDKLQGEAAFERDSEGIKLGHSGDV